VAATTQLTALMAGGALAAFALAARALGRGGDPHRVAAVGALVGLVGFSAVIFAEPLDAANLFRAGAAAIGFGGGLFSVGTLTAAMALERDVASHDGHSDGMNGLVLGAWGAVQATCAGCAVALGGVLRDGVSHLATAGWLGEALRGPVTGYSVVYHLELALLFATLVALGPLVARSGSSNPSSNSARFGLAELPG
jgi:BCD family chlorophyll transporter-like MFS transporter